MRSTFMGLETAKRALFTQQSALHTTGHNIANANTPGFTRQRVNFGTTTPFAPAAMNRPQIPGQMGTGVEANSIQRVRDSFLDIQYRQETNKLGFWDAKSSAISEMENIINEPTTNGLGAVMGEFWQSLQDLSVYPENDGARNVVLERGQSVVDTFHYLNDSLNQINDNIGNEISVSLDSVNSLLEQIASVNSQIGDVEPHGNIPNDLYDRRDNLVDELAGYIDIKVTTTKSEGDPADEAEGLYNISLVGGNGKEEILIAKDNYYQLGFSNGSGNLSTTTPDEVGQISIFSSAGKEIPSKKMDIANENGELLFSQGKLRGLIESYGYSYQDTNGDPQLKGTYPEMLDNLDRLAYTFSQTFNAVHEKGINLEGEKNIKFFGDLEDDYKDASKLISMGDISSKQIAASTTENANDEVNAGDGKNAVNLSNIQNWLMNGDEVKLEGFDGTVTFDPNDPGSDTDYSLIGNASMNSFYEGVIGKLGVQGLQANRLAGNSEILQQSVNEKRMSVSSVSLDEEMTNMIQFQHAYNAAARNITMVDEMLDKIINGMGLVGR
ncbi:flagellar hook-associated protein FlgK [Jeotgalibacillus alimentarius]|uniref:Flagellar hook-associated protein 1 n=1 Tax=Jeotgalibacillus alimentarius TaxID=135826 RepID=A0A0C2VQ81_9BACL|nr:flagellar hook-associated protein FlgK [Jeotgalibacillus alimentarius]KIL46586.1 flagellar hook-associated protein FlgK [Jeotgalibacillus alimentarius]